MSQDGDQQKLVELINDIPIAMMTTFGADGPRSLPMARQEAEVRPVRSCGSSPPATATTCARSSTSPRWR